VLITNAMIARDRSQLHQFAITVQTVDNMTKDLQKVHSMITLFQDHVLGRWYPERSQFPKVVRRRLEKASQIPWLYKPPPHK
jgi:hypothetical protein